MPINKTEAVGGVNVVLPELGYYILSLKHSPGYKGKALWWGPDNSGYVEDLEQAGLYTREQIEEKRDYYDDGYTTLPVREDIAINESRVVRLVPWNGAKWWRNRVDPDERNQDGDS